MKQYDLENTTATDIPFLLDVAAPELNPPEGLLVITKAEFTPENFKGFVAPEFIQKIRLTCARSSKYTVNEIKEFFLAKFPPDTAHPDVVQFVSEALELSRRKSTYPFQFFTKKLGIKSADGNLICSFSPHVFLNPYQQQNSIIDIFFSSEPLSEKKEHHPKKSEIEQFRDQLIIHSKVPYKDALLEIIVPAYTQIGVRLT